MAKIEGISIKNFRSLKNVTLGRVLETNAAALTDMSVVIGKNGVGKSTLFDVFGFLSDALKFGVEYACEQRGGVESIRSQGQSGPIHLIISYKGDASAYPFIYRVSIDADELGRPFVDGEFLSQKAKNGYRNFLMLIKGMGFSLRNNEHTASPDILDDEGIDMDEFLRLSVQLLFIDQTNNEKSPSDTLDDIRIRLGIKNAEIVELADNRMLGISTLGALNNHPTIAGLRQFIIGWYLSYFTPDAARILPLSGVQKHLNSKGDNLANVVQFMEREHRASFQSILDRIAEKIPGIDKIRTEKTSDGRLLLCFNDQGFQDPFYAPQMSDGTLKVFAYLLLLEDPNPRPFICIEEPENGLYHKLLETLAAEFRAHATGRDGGSQLFITTHQPYFVDALDPEEVWVLEKGEDGFSTITRASEIPYVQKMVDEGLPLGGLWYSDYLDAR